MTRAAADDIDPPELGDDEPESFEELPAEDPEHAGPARTGEVDLGVFVPAERLAGGRTRARTISIKRLSKHELERGRLMYPMPAWAERPITRAGCEVCPTCQAWRDTQDGSEDPCRSTRLACGHSTVEAVAHSRPCLYVACKYALYLDVSEGRGEDDDEGSGSIKLNFPDLEPEEMGESCAQDVADRGGITLEDVGAVYNLTRERVRQYETRGTEKLRRRHLPVLRELAELSELAVYQDDAEEDDAPPAPARAPVETDSAAGRALDLLRGTPHALLTREVMDALSLEEPVARSALRRLLAGGLVARESGGRWTRWRAVREGGP